MKFARAEKIAQETMLHEDTFAQVEFSLFFSRFFFTITVIPNPYPRSVTNIF